jgi:hypothetical protein
MFSISLGRKNMHTCHVTEVKKKGQLPLPSHHFIKFFSQPFNNSFLKTRYVGLRNPK